MLQRSGVLQGPSPARPCAKPGQFSSSQEWEVLFPEGWQGLPQVWKCCKGSALPDEHVHKGHSLPQCVC